MSHPYVPLGTPVTITVDGFWDGDHNGNQPVIVVPNGQGDNKKFHVPHGALVQAKTEEVAEVKVEFYVDKTPKPQPTYPDFSKPKLRTMKDRDGDRWSEVAPDVWYDHPPASLRELDEQFGPLTDVTDTGEPLDTETDYVPMSYEEAEYWGRMDDYDEKKDTPRKPEPGDRVRVSYEAEYHEHAEDGHFVRPNDLDFPILTPSDVEITVIEPARPKVPEDPKRDLEEVWHNQNSDEESEVHEYNRHTGLYVGAGGSNTWEHLWTWTQEYGHKLYPLVTTRGPVIGGSDE